jgi:DNA-binding transcriptional LysR family regulator
MTPAPRVTLDQWRALLAVVDSGGHAQAAEALHKSQSSVTHALQQLQSLLGVKAFELRGRKSVLTPTGQLLYRRARAIVEEAADLERSAKKLSAGWEAEIAVALEIIFPTWLFLGALDRFGAESPHTHIEVLETVIGGTREALLEGRADLAVTPHVPPGFESRHLMRTRLVAVANPKHPLHAMKRRLTLRDLKRHRHVVVRETSARRDKRSAVIDAEQRWSVGHMATSILAVARGYGFAWFPEDKIVDEVKAGMLKPLPLAEGGERFADFYLVFRERDSAGPGTLRLAQIIAETVAARGS